MFGCGAPALARGRAPRVIISQAGGTLRLHQGGKDRIFPVGVGRRTPGGFSGPLGTVRMGPDPRDGEYYIPARFLPAFYVGLPFLRLQMTESREHGKAIRPYSIHGPVTPTLIWGRVSRGCVRMRPDHIRLLYKVAVKNPGMPVTFIRGLDRIRGEAVKPDADGPALDRCAEAALGVRRLRRLTINRPLHHRVCGGVDHWYALELSGGDVLTVQLKHQGALRVEFFGIRAISSVRAGRFGLQHRVPLAHHNRGDRYLRVVAPDGRDREFFPYSLQVTTLGAR